MVHKRFLSSTGKLVVAVALCSAVGAAAQSSLSINVGQATYTISKEIYGALLEQTSTDIYRGLYVGTASSVPNVNGMRKDVIAAFKECGVTCLDWPGGCEAERYNWRDGIGAKTARVGGDMSNGMGTPEYFQLCDSVGSLPYITANIRGLSAAGMTAWLNYIDSVYPNKLKYWKMGNEPWGGCTGIGVPALSITAYLNLYNQYKAAIPAKLAGKFPRIIDGGSGDYLGRPTWIDSIMRTEMGSIEGATYHYYGAFAGPSDSESYAFNSTEYYSRLAVQWLLDGKLRAHDSIMTRYDPNYTVALMVDEWGSWYAMTAKSGRQYTQSTCRDAVIASMNLNTFHNRCRRIKMACVAQPVNFIQPLVLTQWPATNSIVKTPTFYVYKMYKVHQNAKMVPTIVSTTMNQNSPLITASSSVDSQGKLHISMCNTHISAVQNVSITLTGAPGYTSCTGTIINGTAYNSYNDFNVAEKVNIQNFTGATMNGSTITVAMPAHSVVTLELTPAVGAVKPSIDKVALSLCEITNTAKGKVVLRYTVAERTSFTLGLYTIDGRSVVETRKGTFEPGKTQFVWQPKNIGRGTNVYIVKMHSDRFTKSQCVLFQR